MKLYCSRTSPYSRKVRIVIRELGLEARVDELDTDPFSPSEDFLATNPLSKIPALVTEDGICLPDSRLIIDYLLSLKPDLARTESGPRRWTMLRREYIAAGLADAAVSTYLEKRRPESIIYTGFIDRQAQVAARALDVLEGEAEQLLIEHPGMTEFTMAAALGYIDFRLPYWDWRNNRELLAGWYAEFSQRPSVIETRPPE